LVSYSSFSYFKLRVLKCASVSYVFLTKMQTKAKFRRFTCCIFTRHFCHVLRQYKKFILSNWLCFIETSVRLTLSAVLLRPRTSTDFYSQRRNDHSTKNLPGD